ncbi:DNA-binding protein [Arenimonas donghaensis]|uniref:KfrA N-terminal DNA-binding domain-containing protein n=2 Tax=Arenimonas TaxID=490567 RepID=A0A087MLW8_9GAMM|nr:DNA-binding protein [Arenimonas donghaensis]KFL37871.1 hypothetical protein N788_01500 [Arenimonas donghaensis DSM 18148 = HO3-R19]
MARGVTQEQVNTAIEQLLLAGERPTIERVRATLGTGSPNTLTRMLDVWWQGLGERLAAHRRSAAIPNAPTLVVDAASALWEIALKAAGEAVERDLEGVREALTAERQALEDEKQAMAAALAAAQLAQNRAEQANLDTQVRLADMQRLVDQQSSQIADLQSRLIAADKSASELAIQLQRAEAARAQTQEEAAADRRNLEASHRAAENRWLTEVDQLRQERTRMSRQLQQAEKEFRSKLQDGESRLSLLSGQVRDVGRREAAATARAAALESQLDRLHEQIKAQLKPSRPARRRPAAKKTDSAL